MPSHFLEDDITGLFGSAKRAGPRPFIDSFSRFSRGGGANQKRQFTEIGRDRLADQRERQSLFDASRTRETEADSAFLRDRGLLREKAGIRSDFLSELFGKFEGTRASQDDLNSLFQTSRDQVGIGKDQLGGLFGEGGEEGEPSGFLGQLLSKQRDAFNVGQDRNLDQLRNFLIREGGAGSLSSGKAGLTTGQFLSDSNAALGASQSDTISRLFPSLLAQSSGFFNKSADKRFSDAPDINTVLGQLGSV